MRGRVHVALPARGSRIALYDLRESLEAATPAASPLPVEFLAALSTAGDASCLEAVAAAYARNGHRESQETTPGGAIAWPTRSGRSSKREQLTRRHAVVKKIEKRWGSALEQLWAARGWGGGKGRAGGTAST